MRKDKLFNCRLVFVVSSRTSISIHPFINTQEKTNIGDVDILTGCRNNTKVPTAKTNCWPPEKFS